MTEVLLSEPVDLGLTDLEKSAIVMLSIGEESAAEVMKYMTQLEINLLSLAMARISSISKTEVTAVYQEFIDTMLQETSIGIGSSRSCLNISRRVRPRSIFFCMELSNFAPNRVNTSNSRNWR